MAIRERRTMTEIEREIRRLGQQANHLDHLGQYDEASELRGMAIALVEAEAQRLFALDDARAQVARYTDRLVCAQGSQERMDIRRALNRQKARVLMLESAKA